MSERVRKNRTGDAEIHVENEEVGGPDVSNREVSEMVDGENRVEGVRLGHQIEQNRHAVRNVVTREIPQNEQFVVGRTVDHQHDRPAVHAMEKEKIYPW